VIGHRLVRSSSVKVGAMAEGGICMGTNERTEVNTIADCGDGADGRGGMWGERDDDVAHSSLVIWAQTGSKPLLNDWYYTQLIHKCCR